LNATAGGREAAPVAADQPVLLVNPRSFRAARWGLAARAVRLARAAGLEVHEVVDPASVRTLFDALRARRQQQVWMLAGDGTIHALAEYFAEHPADDWSPALLFLAGGRANIVPRECGGYPAIPALRRALARLRAGQALAEGSLPTLRLSQPGQPVRHGFLLAGAMVYEGVRLCGEHRARGTGWLHRGFVADPYVLLKLLVKSLLGRSELPPYPVIGVRLANGETLQAPLRVLLASSLELRRALYNPFAARGEGPVRLTAVASTAAHFWRHLPAILGGRFGKDMDLAHGILSGRSSGAELTGVAGYALDGETFTADPGLPLQLAPGVALRVLTP
jgi:hypothetical protein